MGEGLRLVPQKLLPPSIGETVVQRVRLTQRVRESGISIVNIVAPAGFGKTVLLSQLTETLSQPAIWYHLDEYDNDPAVFWRYLIVGLQRLYPGLGREALCFIENSQATLDRGRTVLSMLINELDTCQDGVTLVFDDCHVISETDVRLFVEEFLRRLPPHMKVVMAGRTDAFRLSRLQVQGRLLRYGAGDLRFSHEDIAVYCAKNGIELAGADLEAVTTRTEGWPLAVSMLLSLPEQGKTGVAGTDMDSLFDYMASEVLAGEEESVRGFLTAISVLDEITPEHCDLLLGRKDSRAILASLHRKYFFLGSAGKNEAYRYHQLFREFLLRQLGNERFELLEKAGAIAYQAGEIERAAECFIAAGNLREARGAIIEAGRRLIGRGNWHTVERWLTAFPEEEIASSPWLALYKAQIDVGRGRIYAGDSRTSHALAAFLDTGERLGLAEGRLLKARILRSQGRYQESLELLELAIPDLRGEETRERFDLYLEQSYVLMFCGRFADAEKVLTEALRLAEHRGDTVLMACFYEGLGTVNFAWGYYDRALYYCRRGMAISPDKSLRNHVFQDSIGPVYQDWGELDRAYEYLLQSVTSKESFGPAESLPSAYCQLGGVLLDRGEAQRAEEYLRRALSIIEDRGGDHFVRILSGLLLSICLGVQGRLVEAQALAAGARSQAGGQSRYIDGIFQVLECLFMLQTGNAERAYSQLRGILPGLERVGARKPLCIAYSVLALVSVLKEDADEEDTLRLAERAFRLAADMNFVHDFLLSFEVYEPLLYLALEKGIEVPFIQKIATMAGQRAIPLLQRLAGDSRSSVRLRAINPLAQIGGRKAEATLNKLAGDVDMDVSGQAGRLLQGPSAPIPRASSLEARESIRLVLLGPLGIFCGDREITHVNWARNKSRDLLVYLAHLGSPAGKEKIIDALWPDASYQQANAIFHITLHNLRRILERETGRRDLVLYRGRRYHLPMGSIIVDKQRFQDLLNTAGRPGCWTESSVPLLEEAVALYRGDYLEEMDYAWVIAEQEYLKQLHNRARDSLSLYYVDKRDYPRAIIHLERLVRDNPLTEEYYCRLFSAYAGIGDLRAISLHYRNLKTALKEELGLSPSRRVQDAYSSLISGR